MALLEDAVTLADHAARGADDVGRSDLAARSAADNLMLAALAALGEVRWDLKALPRIVRRLSAGHARLPGVLTTTRALAFPEPASLADGRYPALVLDYAADLFRYVRGIPELIAVVDFLRLFGVGRWELDANFLCE
jgi:hypothetical protein